jgi:hypothetical protein
MITLFIIIIYNENLNKIHKSKVLNLQIDLHTDLLVTKYNCHSLDLIEPSISFVQAMTILYLYQIPYSLYRMRITKIDKYIEIDYKIIRNQYCHRS